MPHYVVGIDGRQTPDPEYWFDRWVIITLDTEEQAIQEYYKVLSLWLREDEKPHVKVHGTAPSATYNIQRWLRENGFIPDEVPAKKVMYSKIVPGYYCSNCNELLDSCIRLPECPTCGSKIIWQDWRRTKTD